MKRLLAAIVAVMFGAAIHAAPVRSQAAGGARRITELASDWRFTRGDVGGADSAGFDDRAWQRVSVPHDWAIAGPFDRDNKSGGAGAFLPGGVSFYRRHVALAAGDAGKRIFVEFDGVMAHSKVWWNGRLLGERPNGYVSFGYEVTEGARFGADNVLVVRTDTSQQPASRWYEGAGIYRKVRLVEEEPVHVARWGTFVTTPEVSAASAKVRVQVAVMNQSEKDAAVRVEVRLVAPDGEIAGTARSGVQTVNANGRGDFDVSAVVPRPDRWDVGHPALYRAEVRVVSDGKTSDVDGVNFGVREFHFDAATGFWLNGKNFKLYGACLHGDVGGLGIAVPEEAYREQLQALQALGVNAVRTAHGPPSPEFLEAADKLGVLVMDEMFDMWSIGKNPYDYHLDFDAWHVRDTKDTAMRDRNHPSIILWSAGNEIRDTPHAELAKGELASIVNAFHEGDPTRPVTQALFRPNASHDYDDGLADLLDVVGQNYREKEILAAHAQKPSRKIVGTENTHDRDQWLAMRDHPEYSGQFIWSGTDYLGEARHWPEISRSTGLLDRTDWPHARGLERESWWSSKPVVHIVRRTRPTPKAPTDPGYELQQMGGAETVFADWTPESLAPHDEHVEVYSNCSDVELWLNGTSLGTKARNADDAARTWTVAFAPGSLRAVCGGPVKAEEALQTAGEPERIVLAPESGRVGDTFDDLVRVQAFVEDAAGVRVPRTHPELHFAVTGAGVIVAVDNGDLVSHESFQGTQRAAFDGMAVAYVRATAKMGHFVVTASADGLKSGAATLNVEPQ
ncbi:MAG TPA: glycoside hydrolase family 2 TIM barrel-domain containing protein [Acidobacteriaceae bacterium]|nr:glycoside hydrolase family 2 TIM barrel-domain containing protein [Acidobacteriaceae bacterium]